MNAFANQERSDRIESNAKRANAVLNLLLSGLQSDDGLSEEMIEEGVSAAIALLQAH